MFGENNYMWASDFPHQDSTWPNTPDVVRDIAARVTPEELELLMRGNTIAMLDLDPRDLRPEHLRT